MKTSLDVSERSSGERRSRGPLASHRSWPEEARRRYREAGLWTTETFSEFVVERCSRFADRPAVIGRDVHGGRHHWTYAELARRVATVQAHLRRAGVGPGDRVVVALPNVVEHVTVVLALFRGGAVPVFALPTHGVRELTEFCARSDAAALVVAGTGPDDGPTVEQVRTEVAGRGIAPPVVVRLLDLPRTVLAQDELPPAHDGAHAEEVALLQLSGGTTGVSKLIPRTAADYLYSVRASAEICGTDSDTRMLVVLPMAHNFSMSSPGVLGVLHGGGRIVLAPDPSPATAFRLVGEEGVTTVALVPPLAQSWIAAARRRRPDLGSLEVVQVGGAKLAPAVAEQVGPVLGARLQQVFGMAEGLVNYTRDDDPDDLVTTTQGRPISHFDELRVVHEDGTEVAAGDEGELLTRGPYTIRGYVASPEADRSSFTADGFYRTGDLVTLLPSGHLRVTGRVKDQINRAGEKVATVEVEEPLLRHPAVLDVVALGLPDPFLGECVVAVVVPAPAADDAVRAELPDTLAAHLRAEGLASWKLPDRYVVLDALPATGVGKNSRRDLRAELARSLAAP